MKFRNLLITLPFLLLLFVLTSCSSTETEPNKTENTTNNATPENKEPEPVATENLPVTTGIIGKWEYVETQLTSEVSAKVLHHWTMEFQEDGQFRNEVKIGPDSEMKVVEDSYTIEGKEVSRNDLPVVEVVELSATKMVVLSFGKAMTLKKI